VAIPTRSVVSSRRLGRCAVHTLDLTALSLLTFVVVVYYALLFLFPLVRRSRPTLDVADHPPFMVIVIPAHNEEAVIAPTLDSVLAIDYLDRLVLVMNDGSQDRTSEIARSYASRGVQVVDRAPEVAGQGKGAVLNHAFAIIQDLAADPASVFGGRPTTDIVIGVLDADGQLERHALRDVAPYFADDRVAGVQIGVRIANADTNIVTRMQDLEFVGFSALVQEARDAFGSVGLGGNGQFTRLSALASLGRPPWTACLTEDLELSLSLAEAGWKIRFCPTAYVAQQGLTRWRPLLRQRTRWVQGHYQCWRHLPSLWRARSLPWYTRLDLSIYLGMVTFVMFVFAGVVASIGAHVFGYEVVNNSLSWLPEGHVHNAVILALTFGPLLAFLVTYQRNSWFPLRAWELPVFAIVFSLYAYFFVASQFWAYGRVAMRRGSWAKTPRVMAESVV
jgi:1,2-diacylglycerol 3-beta-glucosyltransferase